MCMVRCTGQGGRYSSACASILPHTHTHAHTHTHTPTRTRTVFQTLVACSHPPIWVDYKLPFHDVVSHFLWACVHTCTVVVELVASLACRGEQVRELVPLQPQQVGRRHCSTVHSFEDIMKHCLPTSHLPPTHHTVTICGTVAPSCTYSVTAEQAAFKFKASFRANARAVRLCH